MPQLDVFTWLSQVLFFSVSSFVFYSVLKLFFMPHMFGLIKMQSKLIKFSANIIFLRKKLSQNFRINFIQYYLLQGVLNLIPLRIYLINSLINVYLAWVQKNTSILPDSAKIFARKKIIRVQF